ncbi:MAG: hypothetical protein AMXMBFR83_18010 [Phycisphaerae bacterium]
MWLAAGFLLPWPDSPRLDDQQPNWRRAARWLTLVGLLIGVAYAVVYRGSWKWFGEYHRLRLLPAAVLLIADLGWCGHRQAAAWSRLVTRLGRAPAPGQPDVRAALTLMLVGLLKFGFFLTIPIGATPYPADWREHLGPLYPGVIYRPIVLMPLWGRWGILLAMSIGRVSDSGSGRLKAMAGGLRLFEAILHWCPIALLTVAYVSPDDQHLANGVVIALAVLVATYLANFTLALRFGGQDEDTVAATGLVAELAFLALYLPIARAIYGY